MAQRFSEYDRRPSDDYPTPPWVTRVLLDNVSWRLGTIWEPAAGKNKMVVALRRENYTVVGTTKDFLEMPEPPASEVQTIITNPPYGFGGKMAVKFIEKALSFPQIRTVAMLLSIDFDSGSTRQHLFRNCPEWAMKVVLLRRIIWFIPEGKKPGSSTNHAWYVWHRGHAGSPLIAYAGEPEKKEKKRVKSSA